MKRFGREWAAKQLEKLKKMTFGQSKVEAKSSLDWFYKEIRGLSFRPPEKFFKPLNDFFIGGMFFFVYDPKHKKTLPYYDKFPLVIPIGVYPDGFLGLNLHYLPPPGRAALMRELIKYRANAGTAKAYMQLSYGMLKTAVRHPLFMPTLKRYLHSHMRSKFAKVDEEFWVNAAMLPVQKFEKKSAQQVWASYRHKRK